MAFDDVLTSVFAVANCGTKISPPSIAGPQLLMPTTPPHVRVPISGPSFACLNMYEKMSPSDAVVPLQSAARWPMNVCAGYVPVIS